MAPRHTAAPPPARRRVLGGLAAGLTACLIAPGLAAGQTTPTLERVVERAPDDARIPVLVTLAAQVDAERHEGSPASLRRALRAAAARTQPGVVAAADAPVERFWLVNALALRASAAQITALAARPDVAAVSLDVEVRTTTAATTHATLASAPWGLGAVRAPQAWRAMGLDGAGVRIGSIDTGVDATHPALAGRIAAWRDFVAGAPRPYDDNGHGTHTVGTMVGGGATPAGVAPGATVVVAKAMSDAGVGRGSDILAAAQWMTDPDGDPATADHPQVVNNSWGTAVRDDPWFRPMIERWIALGIVPVFSAGNTGPGPGTIGSPADYAEALAVGAVDSAGQVAPFSARGVPGSATKPDLVAPGVGVVSTVPGGYSAYSGTSMASPHVAGAAALLRQAAPGLAPAAVMEILRASASDRGPAGPDPAYGFGMLDLPGALAAAGAPALPAPTAPRAGASSGPARSQHSRSAAGGRATGGGRARLARQLSINQRISQATILRANAIEDALNAGLEAADIRAGALTRASFGAGVTIAGTEGALDPPPNPRRPLAVPPLPAGPGAALTPSATQLRVNQRIAQAAVRRANGLRQRMSAGLTGGDIRPGTITPAQLAPGLAITAFAGLPRPPASRTVVAPPGAGGGDVTLSQAQLLINQRISQAAIRRLNGLRERIETGLTAGAFAPGTITGANLAR